jgi:hypothetical protein
VRVMTDSAHQDAARELLESIRPGPAEIDSRFEQALSPAYWKTLVPALALDEGPVDGDAVPALDAAARSEIAGRFAEEGYFVLAPRVPPSVIERMRTAVTTVERAGWPPVFAWMYDQFWRVPRARPLVDLFSAILGAAYRQTPNIWTHVVPGHRGATGWAPHVDHRGTGTRLTIWIPLSDATVDSGCMCVLPKHLVPRRLAGRWYETPTLEMKEAIRVIHAARPLPAKAGAIVGWNAGLLHWGAAREVSGDPRISVSMEFAAPGGDVDRDEQTLAATDGSLPPFDVRLRTIARGIVIYRESDLRASRHLPLAERLLARLGQT